MDKRITRFSSLEAMKAAEYHAWQHLPAQERLRAVMDITTALYRMKGQIKDVPRLQRTLTRIQRV